MSQQHRAGKTSRKNIPRHALAWWLLVLATSVLGAGTVLLAQRTSVRKHCLQTSRATALLLEERRRDLSAEAARLARKFGQWEIRPAAAMQAELRASLRQRIEIDDIAIFDPNGMEIQRFSTTRPPGTRTAQGVMDQEDWRRHKLIEDKTPMESYRVAAGRVHRLEASAPILGDGLEGYVVAGVSMERMLSGVPDEPGLTIRDGDCILRPSGGTCAAQKPAGRWTVSLRCHALPAWPFLGAGLLLVLASLGLFWSRPPREAATENPSNEPLRK